MTYQKHLMPHTEQYINMISLLTLEDATQQEVFDQVKNHLLQQHEQAGKESGCFYRHINTNGVVLKCAAGCLMTDEEISHYNIPLDKPWRVLVSDYGITHEHYDLIEDLQAIHDTKHPIEWEYALEQLAFNYALFNW